MENRPTSDHSLGEQKGGSSAVFGGTTVLYRSLPCSGGWGGWWPNMCWYGWTPDCNGGKGVACFFAFKVGLSDVKASECWKWWEKFKISLQWKGERSPVSMTQGVWTFGGSLLKMIQFLRGSGFYPGWCLSRWNHGNLRGVQLLSFLRNKALHNDPAQSVIVFTAQMAVTAGVDFTPETAPEAPSEMADWLQKWMTCLSSCLGPVSRGFYGCPAWRALGSYLGSWWNGSGPNADSSSRCSTWWEESHVEDDSRLDSKVTVSLRWVVTKKPDRVRCRVVCNDLEIDGVIIPARRFVFPYGELESLRITWKVSESFWRCHGGMDCI